MSSTMEFNNFCSYFELVAAFCLTYASFEAFMEEFTEKFTFIENKQLERKDFHVYLKGKNPLAMELSSIAKRHRIFFFHVFISCIFYLVFAGYEKFYSIPVNQGEFCGIVLIPFASILYFWIAMPSIVNHEQIKTELKLISSNEQKFKYTLEKDKLWFDSAKTHMWSFFWGFMLIFFIWALDHNFDLEFFTDTKKKFLILFCMTSVYIPFISQWLQYRRAVKRYSKEILAHIAILKAPKTQSFHRKFKEMNKYKRRK